MSSWNAHTPDNSNSSPAYTCAQMTMKVLQVLILALQIDLSEWVQIQNPWTRTDCIHSHVCGSQFSASKVLSIYYVPAVEDIEETSRDITVLKELYSGSRTRQLNSTYDNLDNYNSPPLFVGNIFQDPQWMPETAHNTEPYICYLLPPTHIYIPMIKV